jgi:hypothetical protein
LHAEAGRRAAEEKRSHGANPVAQIDKAPVCLGDWGLTNRNCILPLRTARCNRLCS